MASLSISSSLQAAGLSSSSFHGPKLPSFSPSKISTARAPPRVGVATAKYGEKSVYFDLEDIGNTTGAWDLYGSDSPSPYNGLQSKFFEVFGGAFTKRGLLLKFLLLGGGGSLAYVSSTAGPDLLPIKKGPQEAPKAGPRGKI